MLIHICLINSIQVDLQCTRKKLKKFNKKWIGILLVSCHHKIQDGAHNNQREDSLQNLKALVANEH